METVFASDAPPCPACGADPLAGCRPQPAEIVACRRCGALLAVHSLRPLRLAEAQPGDLYWGE